MKGAVQSGYSLLLAIALVLGLPISQIEAGYEFPDIVPKQVRRVLNLSTVRVFKSEKDERQAGSGFVIDNQKGLVVTAGHVVGGADVGVWLAFPKVETRYPARVLIAPNDRDFAVLKLESRPNTPQLEALALELQLESINDEEDHRLTGFGRVNGEPILRNGQPSWLNNCQYIIGVQTIPGDSGSAVLTAHGLVDGIAILGSEYQGDAGNEVMGLTWILPLSCIRDKILSFVPNDDDATVLKAFSGGDERTLRRLFQPLETPPERAGWITNLRLARALIDFIVDRRSEKRTAFLNIRRASAALQIIMERQLGRNLATEFVVASTDTTMEAGDAFQKFGEMQESVHADKIAKLAYESAANLYRLYAADKLSSNWLLASKKNNSDPTVARAYKSAADSQTKIAEITANPADYKEAAQLAAAAAFFAPSGKLKSSSLAALGSALHGAGDTPAAVGAFQKAEQTGPTAQWTKSSLSHLRTLLGSRSPSDLTDEYFAGQAKIAVEAAIPDLGSGRI